MPASSSSPTSSAKELEQELKNAGHALLLSPPSSIDKLLQLLDKVEHLLTKVGQNPSESMKDALLPSMKALIADEMLKHTDAEIKLSVVSCIAEITRITAPDAPYADNDMKEIFQLTVTSFEKLCMFGRCYSKAVQILHSMALVHSCLLMLDLDSNALIVDMFQKFLSTISSNHPRAVFSDMESIMTLVIKEIDEIPLALVTVLLNSVRKEKQNISSLAEKLAEKVLANCAAELKSSLPEAMISLNLNFSDFSEIVVSLCQDASERGHVMAAGLAQAGDAMCTEQVAPSLEGLSTIATDDAIAETQNDGTAEMRNNENLVVGNSLRSPECFHQPTQKISDAGILSQPCDSDANPTVEPANDAEPIPRRRNRKPNSMIPWEEVYDHPWTAEKQSLEILKCTENNDKKSGGLGKTLGSRDSAQPKKTENALPLEHDTSTKSFVLSVGALENESMKASASQRVQAKESKKNQDGNLNMFLTPEEKNLQMENVSMKNKSIGTRTFEAKSETCPTENANVDTTQKRGRKKKSRVITIPQKHVLQHSGNKEMVSTSVTKSIESDQLSLRDSSKQKHKRKRTIQKEKNSMKPRHTKKNGKELVGCRIKVWWPIDQMFYEGVVSSFDQSTMKHKVSYDDGDEELLKLNKERWELIPSNQVEESDLQRPAELVSEYLSPVEVSDELVSTCYRKKASTKSHSSGRKISVSSRSGVGASDGKLKIKAPDCGGKSADVSTFEILHNVDQSKDKGKKDGATSGNEGKKVDPSQTVPSEGATPAAKKEGSSEREIMMDAGKEIV